MQTRVGPEPKVQVCIPFVTGVPLISALQRVVIKGRYTIGHCQRPVFSHGVSHHVHEIISL